jgi:hypothetical protein
MQEVTVFGEVAGMSLRSYTPMAAYLYWQPIRGYGDLPFARRKTDAVFWM